MSRGVQIIDRQEDAPRNTHTLTLGICKYVVLYGTGEIKLVN